MAGLTDRTRAALSTALGAAPGAATEISALLDTSVVTLSQTSLSTLTTTAATGTVLAATIAGGYLSRSGPTGNFTDTTDTAANIITALPGNVAVNTSWQFWYVNTTAFQATISAATGVTLAGLATPVPANSTAMFLCKVTSATAVSMSCVDISYDAALGYDPSSVQTQFGSSTGTFGEEGNINKQILVPAVSPTATGVDNVIAVYSLPANSLDGTGNRGLTITAIGTFATNTHNKEVKLFWAPVVASLGSTISGGTLLADTGTVSTNGGGWWVGGNVFKYGAANSNTQLCTSNGAISGGTHNGVSATTTAGATESAAILIAVTANTATTTTDVSVSLFVTSAQN